MVLSKRGRPRLRFLMTMSMVMTNPEIRALHRFNVEEKEAEEDEVHHEVMQ